MLHLTNLSLKKFTCFSDLELSFSPGINVFIGANGTGKTHILKVLYSACAITTKAYTEVNWLHVSKLIETLSPFVSYRSFLRENQPGRNCEIEIQNSHGKKCFSKIMSSDSYSDNPSAVDMSDDAWRQQEIPSLYIPVKEILSHASGFLSLVRTRQMAFDDTYSDILTQVFLPPLKEPHFQELQGELLASLKAEDILIKGENFYLKNSEREFEFSFVAEGLRKIALLLLLIRNGSIAPGTVLFWDEPEANMNPVLLNLVVKSLLTFQRAGIQIFLTTHNYVLLKEFDLQATEKDKIRYFSLYFDDKKDGVQASISDSYLGIENSEIARTYDDLFNREMERKFK